MKKILFTAFLAVLLATSIAASWAGNGCCQKGSSCCQEGTSCCSSTSGSNACGGNCTCVDADKDGKCDNCGTTYCINGGECCGCCACTTTTK
jgi:hypothetical protein